MMVNYKDVVLGLAFFMAVLCAGCSLKGYDYPDDNLVEEGVESVLESLAEDQLGLPDGMLDDKLDLTPWSDEEK